jgi:hypothetical protein
MLAKVLLIIAMWLTPCQHQYFATKTIPVFSTRTGQGLFYAIRVVEETCIHCGHTKWFGRDKVK